MPPPEGTAATASSSPVTDRLSSAGPRRAVQQFGQLFDGDRVGVVECSCRDPIFENGRQRRVLRPFGRQVGDRQRDRVPGVAPSGAPAAAEIGPSPTWSAEMFPGDGAFTQRAASVKPQIWCAPAEGLEVAFFVAGLTSIPLQCRSS